MKKYHDIRRINNKRAELGSSFSPDVTPPSEGLLSFIVGSAWLVFTVALLTSIAGIVGWFALLIHA